MLDVGALDRLGGRMEARERDRSVQHAEQLIDGLAVQRTLKAAGMELSTGPQLALFLGCSEYRAEMLLSDAKVLHRLGALEPMHAGLLTVEQSRVVSDLLGVLDDGLGASLWERLADRLRCDQDEGISRPPARLRELLQKWLIEADPDGYAERRKTAAEDSADVELWKQDDGLVDLVTRSLPAADAQACADRIEQHAQQFGADDTRPAGVRRRDAARTCCSDGPRCRSTLRPARCSPAAARKGRWRRVARTCSCTCSSTPPWASPTSRPSWSGTDPSTTPP